MDEEKVVEETPVAPVQPAVNVSNEVPEKYKPISMWGYFGYELLFSIPCIGFILLCVFSFGGTPNINLRNFARSYFCFLILFAVLGLIIFIILSTVFGIGLAASGVSSNAINESAVVSPY